MSEAIGIIALHKAKAGGAPHGKKPYYSAGTTTFENLPAPTAANLNGVYNVENAFVTDSRFAEGSGIECPAGTDVACFNAGTTESPVYMYDIYAGGLTDLMISKAAAGTSFTLTDAADGHVQNIKIKGATDSTSAKSVGENGLTIQTCGKNICGQLLKNTVLDWQTGRALGNPNCCVTDFIPVKANQSYTISYNTPAAENWRYNSDKQATSRLPMRGEANPSVTYTPNTDEYIRCSVKNEDVDIFQIELGSTATAYEPYHGTSATLTTGAPYCSLSESLTDEVDMLAGVVHKKCYSVTFDGSSDENWVIDSVSTPGTGGSKRFDNSTKLKYPIKSHLASQLCNAIASGLTIATINDIQYADAENAINVGDTPNAWTTVSVRVSGISTAADLKTYLASHPVTVVYELATPYDAPLTSAEISALTALETYSGITNIAITDSPETEIDYLRDTENGQAAADMQVNIYARMDALNTAFIAPEYDSTATYAVDDYVIYGGKLYKCTTAVSTAETFDSTKWTATTVMAEIAGA